MTAQQQPNILLLYADAWRFDWSLNGSLSAQSLNLSTPNFDGLAARGVQFNAAYVPAPLCAPSRAALALGREFDDNEVPSNEYDVPTSLTTVYRALRDTGGYHVMVSGKDDLSKASGYGGDGSTHAAELGYSAWKGRTPGKSQEGLAAGSGPCTRRARALCFEPSTVCWQMCLLQMGYSDMRVSRVGADAMFLHQREVQLDNGSTANALDVHNECTSRKAHAGSSLKCCRHAHRAGVVCSRPLPGAWPEEWYLDNWVGAEALQMLRERPEGRPCRVAWSWTGPAVHRATAQPPPKRCCCVRAVGLSVLRSLCALFL